MEEGKVVGVFTCVTGRLSVGIADYFAIFTLTEVGGVVQQRTSKTEVKSLVIVIVLWSR